MVTIMRVAAVARHQIWGGNHRVTQDREIEDRGAGGFIGCDFTFDICEDLVRN